jgi:hypothetical protein
MLESKIKKFKMKDNDDEIARAKAEGELQSLFTKFRMNETVLLNTQKAAKEAEDRSN